MSNGAPTTKRGRRPAGAGPKLQTTRVQVLLGQNVADALDEHRWSIRAESVAAVIADAVSEYITNHKIEVGPDVLAPETPKA